MDGDGDGGGVHTLLAARCRLFEAVPVVCDGVKMDEFGESKDDSGGA